MNVHPLGICLRQSTPTEKLGNKEDPKRDIHGPLEKGKGTRSPELIGSMGEGRELGEREGEKKRGEENMREQEDQVGGRIEESKKRDTIIEGA